MGFVDVFWLFLAINFCPGMSVGGYAVQTEHKSAARSVTPGEGTSARSCSPSGAELKG